MVRDPAEGFVNEGWPPEIQELVNRLVSSTKGGGDCADTPDFEELTGWLEERIGEEGIDTGEAGDLLPAVDLNVTSLFEDDSLRDSQELDEDSPITDRMRLRYMREVLGDLVEDPSALDADYHPTCFLVYLRARNGKRAILAGGVKGYSFTMVEYEWYGLFESKREFQRCMLEAGIVTSAKAFARLPAATRLSYWRG